MYRLHTSCRACGLGSSISTLKESAAAGPRPKSESLVPVFDLGIQPLANDFVNGTEEHAGFAPLKVLVCPRCILGQLSVVVNPMILYKHYAYVTSPSATMRQHFKHLVNDLEAECGRGAVIEIGSNDGTLLDYIRKQWTVPVLGIEPAENLSAVSNQNGVPTLNCFLNADSAKTALKSLGEPQLIVARHVFCHIDRWDLTLKSLESICGRETLICIEVPYSGDMLRLNQFDTIYHEHLSYLNLKAMDYALKGTCLHIHAVKRYQIHGGTIAVMIRRNDSLKSAQPLFEENVSLSDWKAFGNHADVQVMELRSKVRELRDKGKTVAGYGASAKSTVWNSACGFDRNDLAFICDSTKQKWYKLSPGTDIPIVDEGALTRQLPDYAIMYCWNYSREVIEKERIFREKGGKWIIPVPKVEII